MKCPTCHEEYATREGFEAHVPNCAYKDNPLPEPETEKGGDNGSNDDGLDKMMIAELKAIAEGLGIEVPKKPKKWNSLKRSAKLRRPQSITGAREWTAKIRRATNEENLFNPAHPEVPVALPSVMEPGNHRCYRPGSQKNRGTWGRHNYRGGGRP